ncbi:MAG TPA: MFS transporter, partial [Acidimicrobiales bacterium]|nr:MFS transporter [Acidimicrobiales bacterium]
SRLLTDRGATELLIGLSLSLFGLPFMVLAPLGGRLAERRGPLLAASVALIVSDGFMASYGFVPWPIIIVLLGIGEACAQCVAVPGGYAAVARAWPDDRAATGQGWFSGAGTAAAGAASLAGAPTYAALGPGAVFAGGAGISVLLALAGLVVAGSGRRALAAPAADQAAGPRGDAVAGLAADPVAGPAADAAAGPAADPVAGPAATPDAAARPAAGDARTRGRPVGAPPDRHLP